MVGEVLDVAAGLWPRGLVVVAVMVVGVPGCYLMALIVSSVLAARDHRRRLRTGAVGLDDVTRLLAARHLRLPKESVALTRLETSPRLAVQWLRQGEDWGLLLDCFEAGLSDNEVAAHLNGTGPVTSEQVTLLQALQQTSHHHYASQGSA